MDSDANKVFSKLLVLCMFSIGARYLEDEHVPHIGKNSGCKYLADAQKILSELGGLDSFTELTWWNR